MTLWAIVPVKPLRRGKSRLANVLTQDERADLNRRLLAHTLDTLSAIPELEHVLVVSRDQAALSLARDYGARTVKEYGAPKLNMALTRATIIAKQYATRGVLILPADLPLIAPEDIHTMLNLAKNPRSSQRRSADHDTVYCVALERICDFFRRIEISVADQRDLFQVRPDFRDTIPICFPLEELRCRSTVDG